ncbi:hypothetical protein MKW92_000186 [Papaver armeniacum]|nr:hypothetical protein MKW92_023984 [Papaver armeniacum]KAI3940300.1 hypothetical protein MKW92_000186 [Papaver armeniacum]
MKIGNLYFSFTNPSLSMLLTLSLVLLLVNFVTKNGGGNLVPNAWQSLVEQIYDFVLNLVNEQIGGLSGNGMIPYSFTVTSHFLVTLGLSFSIFIGITIVGFQRNGLHFLSFLLPAGVPLALAPFLVLLELISYCFRALSLGIRLFANMMAGHSLVKILSGHLLCLIPDLNLPPEPEAEEEDVPILEGRPVYIPTGVANELSRLHKTILRERRQIAENEAELARTAEKIRNAPMERKAWWDELEAWFRGEDSD